MRIINGMDTITYVNYGRNLDRQRLKRADNKKNKIKRIKNKIDLKILFIDDNIKNDMFLSSKKCKETCEVAIMSFKIMLQMS